MRVRRSWVALVAGAALGCGGTDGSAGSVRSAGGSGGGGDGGEDGKVLVCPCKVTGGGFVFVDDTKVTFGFNAQPTSKKNPVLVDGAFEAKGQFEINFHADEKDKEHGDVETIACFPQEDETVLVRFGGTLKDDGAFTVEVVDRGEPGVDDTIAFTGGGESFPALDLGGGEPGGGNIQLHDFDLSKCEKVEKPPPVCPK